ncbi:hypothetical protein BDM02DRAFT_2771353 [Thelephora ganbajun]|uniref:Uncharacterized protein n=1 Tax=Thelephora ganbajun TaxID=370292 RepID=A0ACB6ZSJ6_THEGA|nr:hypothetical protein BDM02DRAFT_2771353 [Thelephora ganbajun]
MIEDKSTPPSQILTRRLRSLIANVEETTVESSAEQICGWINSSEDRGGRFRGLLRLTAELVLGKAMERPCLDFHHVLGRLCKILDTATDGEYSKSLNSLWKEEIQAAGVELLANDMAKEGSWPECLALVAFVGELCNKALLRPDDLCSCVGMLSNLRSNLGLELACTLLEATGYALCRDCDGKQHFDTAIQVMLLTLGGDGISVPIRRRVQELATQWTSGRTSPSKESSDDVQWDEETVNPDADEERHPTDQTAPQLCKPKHPEFYFGSGDVIFVCEGTSFRVQSDLLSNNSRVFSDMLKPASLNEEHLSDGCPCIHLSDAVDDFVILLRIFYTSGFPHRHKTPDFTTFSSLLRMTTKYELQEIRSQILLDLAPAYPTQLSGYEKSSCRGETVFETPIPHPNLVLNLFVKCNVAFALPFAYYRVCIAGDPASLKTNVKEVALSPETLKTALRGQARLKADEVQLARKVVFQDCSAWKCSGILSSKRVQVFNWILSKTVIRGGILEKGDFSGSGHCPQCTQAFAQELSKAKKDTWRDLPSYFSLPSWNNAAYQPV